LLDMITVHTGRAAAATLLTLTTVGGLATVSTATADAVPTSQPSAVAATAPRATQRDIRIGVRPIHDSSAGHSYVDLTYRNVADHAVTIRGYAGISLVADGNGTQVGRPAVWLTNRRPVTVTLRPGQTTTEILTIADAADYGATKHHTVLADGFRVYLPGSRTAAFVPYRLLATTRNVAQLQVDPIGARI
jgi:hypothetical protein